MKGERRSSLNTRESDTEIDFKTYLQQASIFGAGERDYSLLKGDTGPCV